MSETMDYGLPSFGALYDAILSASDTISFPLDLLKDADQRQALRQAPHLQDFLQTVRQEAEQAYHTPFEPLTFTLLQQFEKTGERVSYEKVYFARRRHVIALTLAILMDRRDDYLDAFHDRLWAICDEYTWALPAHLPVGIDAIQANRLPPAQIIDLFSAETAHMLAEIVHLLGDRLAGWLVQRIRDEIERRIFQALFNHPQTFKWERDTHNWAAVCGGSVGMTALLLETDRERLAGMIDRLMRAMNSFLSGFGSDGGCPEGIGYWVYGFGYYVYFADMLARYTDHQINLLSSEHVQRIANFPQVISLGGSRYINYSDASATEIIHPGLASYLAEHLGVVIPDLKAPDFHSNHICRWAHLTRDLVWSNPAFLHQPVSDGTFYLNQLAWVVDRQTVNGQALIFSAKGGHNDEPHNHNDLGHFIVKTSDEDFLVDLGAGVYTRQYFGAERYTIIHTSSYGHSVPVINGMGQQAGSNHQADVLSYQTYANSLAYVLDLTNAYALPELQSFIRAFDWSVDANHAKATLLLSDTAQFSQPATFEERFISYQLPIIQAGAVIWSGQHAQLTMQFDNQQFDAQIDTIETQNHTLETVTVHQLRLITRERVTALNVELHFELT
jgi:hypothetical protein